MTEQQRDEWLQLPEDELMKSCTLQAFRGTGPGGQKRNVTDSSVRIIHLPSGLSATASESRSQYRNRILALRKLKHEIAFELRQQPEVDETDKYQKAPGRNSGSYPIWAAKILDALEYHDYRISAAATFLGVSSSRLIRDLCKDKRLWQHVNQKRQLHEMTPLRHPKK